MTRDDIRKLLGGYATGTLTEAEQKILFDAALDDQELFEELAREQALKELLDDPGAKTRLIGALKPRETAVAWWKRPWVWSGAMVAVATIIASTWIATRPEHFTQVAQVTPAPAPPPQGVAAQEPAKPSAPPPGSGATSKGSLVRPVVKAKKAAKQVETPEPQADLAAPAGPPPPAPAPIAPIQPAPVQSAPIQSAPAQPFLPQAAPAAPRAKEAETAGTAGVRPQRLEPAQASRLMAPANKTAPRPRFGFDYRLDPDGHLEVKVAADGYLTVPGVYPESFVAKDSTTRVDVPAAGIVAIHFSTQPQAVAGTTPVTIDRDAAAGAVDDPNPSPNSNLTLRLILK